VDKIKESEEVMAEKKYAVPDGMLKAATLGACEGMFLSQVHQVLLNTERILEAAIRWQSENPQAPTDEQMKKMKSDIRYRVGVHFDDLKLVKEWQRRMYLAPEPEVPEETPEIIRFLDERMERYSMWMHRAMDAVIEGEPLPERLDWDKAGEKSKVYDDEAFERGQKARK
jgi:hypothetical protein